MELSCKHCGARTGRGSLNDTADTAALHKIPDHCQSSAIHKLHKGGARERDGRILIGQRRWSDPHPLKWEFPGGKVEPPETPEHALIRELREELAIELTIGAEITRYRYQYPNRSLIELIFYRVVQFQGEPSNLAFEQIVWEAPSKLPAYDFLDGDVEFVRFIAAP
jgi:8-oxo-dGTP diphosphatase